MSTIWGIVLADGTPASGTGYKVFKDVAPGVYDISFTTSFNVRPAVVVTELFPDQANSDGGDTRDNAVVVSIGPTAAGSSPGSMREFISTATSR